MNLNEQILKLVDENEQYIIDCRRKIHTYAEVAMKEVKTHAFILEIGRASCRERVCLYV